MFWSVLLAAIYGFIFFKMGPAHFHVHECLPEYPNLLGFITMLYYSVVTFTTLGFGDVVIIQEQMQKYGIEEE